MSVRAAFSALVTVSRQWCLTVTQFSAYLHQYERFAGFHWDGSWSPFARLEEAETAKSCGLVRSFAKSPRLASSHSFAPERHALASGTVWSMSTSEGSVKTRPSYTLSQWPPTTLQPESRMSSPSRLRTLSRTSQFFPVFRQCGKWSRL